MVITASDLARFTPKIDVRGPNDCWPWTAGCFASGYGAFKVGNQVVRSHRFGWTAWYGPIPPGKQVLHECDNPPCHNPSHWFLGTHATNMADRWAKGRY
jgi:hypothetical protein